jgi:hypothetical protein
MVVRAVNETLYAAINFEVMACNAIATHIVQNCQPWWGHGGLSGLVERTRARGAGLVALATTSIGSAGLVASATTSIGSAGG